MIYLICGKICCGKTRYSQALLKSHKAVLLSCDELMYTLYEHTLGQKHDLFLSRVKTYLFDKAIEIAHAGSDVILDWGFGSREERESTSRRLSESGLSHEWHYINIADAAWQRNIEKRNAAVTAGTTHDVLIDKGLLNKLAVAFEAPDPSDVQVWHRVE